MDPKTKARYQARARIVKAMSHPTRLFIVDQLSKRRRCVRKLTEMVGDDVSTISKHLSVLKNAGIVSDEKEGTQVFYSLRNAKEQAALAK
jgi:ArsR family transcriptional regulator